MGAGEDPNVSCGVNRDHRIVVGIGRVFVQQDRRPWDGVGRVIVVRHHVQKRAVVRVGAAVTEERLVHFFDVDSKRTMFCAVGAQPTAVFVLVFSPLLSALVPNTSIPVGCSDFE